VSCKLSALESGRAMLIFIRAGQNTWLATGLSQQKKIGRRDLHSAALSPSCGATASFGSVRDSLPAGECMY
jgi:hypothetical protein